MKLLASTAAKKQSVDAMPPVSVRPEDRKKYLDTLQHASMRHDLKPFQTFMHQRLRATLGGNLSALQEDAS